MKINSENTQKVHTGIAQQINIFKLIFVSLSYLSFIFFSGLFIALGDPWREGVLPIYGHTLIAGCFSKKGTLLSINFP